MVANRGVRGLTWPADQLSAIYPACRAKRLSTSDLDKSFELLCIQLATCEVWDCKFKLLPFTVRYPKVDQCSL